MNILGETDQYRTATAASAVLVSSRKSSNSNSILRSSNDLNRIVGESKPTIVDIIDLDETSLSSESRKKSHHHRHHHRRSKSPEDLETKRTPTRKKSFIIPTTLIVTDSNEVVIDNIDLKKPEYEPQQQSAQSNQDETMLLKKSATTSQTMPLISSIAETAANKRSDSKSSSIRDNNSIIIDSVAAQVADTSKLGEHGCCCLLFKKICKSAAPASQKTKKPQSFNSLFYLFCIALRNYLIGVVVCILFCASLVVMTYLIRRTFNQKKLDRLNMTLPSRFTIETNSTKHNLDCEHCFSLIWLVTSLLTFLYPIYILMRLVLGNKKKRRWRNISSLFSNSLNVFRNPPLNNYKKIPIFDSNKSFRIGTSQTTEKKGSQLYRRRNYHLKICAITFLWVISGYLYLRAIDLLYCIDVIILFSTNYSFIYMTKWIILHHKFIPLRVIC